MHTHTPVLVLCFSFFFFWLLFRLLLGNFGLLLGNLRLLLGNLRSWWFCLLRLFSCRLHNKKFQSPTRYIIWSVTDLFLLLYWFFFLGLWGGVTGRGRGSFLLCGRGLSRLGSRGRGSFTLSGWGLSRLGSRGRGNFALSGRGLSRLGSRGCGSFTFSGCGLGGCRFSTTTLSECKS